ncbi:MAG: hypothetical protein HN396_18690 [Gemmatimonadales bacterium]|nr:hypothetical protein [Gemmatimonadales bacterium]
MAPPRSARLHPTKRGMRAWLRTQLWTRTRRRASRRLFRHGDELYLEVFLPATNMPETIKVEGREAQVAAIGRVEEIVLPYQGGIQAYGAGFMGGVLVYAAVSMSDYCKAIFFTM